MIGAQIAELLAEFQDMIMGSALAKCALTDLGIQWAGWALASAFKTEKFYDLAGKAVRSSLTHSARFSLSFACCTMDSDWRAN